MKDYFVYLPERTGAIWGCVATSVGFARVSPGSPYPPHRHPVDHHMTWSQGRVLQAYQILLISEGGGFFETSAMPGTSRVEAGTVFVLFPGVWHRYTPDKETGWVEHWLECRGPAFDEAVKNGIIRPEQAVLKTGLAPDVLYCFERCHQLAQRGALASQEMLSTLGLHLISVLGHLQRQGRAGEVVNDAMLERAQALITLRCQEPLSLPEVAAKIGVSYSQFRHVFKSRLGMSPKQFHLQVRLQKAQDLLSNTSKPLKEIAAILGFESPFHLSKQFKALVGESPSQWREKAQSR